MTSRYYSTSDQLLVHLSRSLATLTVPPTANRPYPGTSAENPELTKQEQVESARYMRVNHVGEICAQALYQSQAMTARDHHTQQQMEVAAREEVDHLAWCEQRIVELGGRKSALNPFWYTGAYLIGTVAGLAGNKWNLGFVAETERQVTTHLESHLGKLPEADDRSREIVLQMKKDESQHAEAAIAAGAAELPAPIKTLMKLTSVLMTRTAHWI